MIAVTAGTQSVDTGYGVPYPTTVLDSTYVEAVVAAGGLPVVVPVANLDVHALMGRVDGLLITGGGDVSPAAYGQEPSPQVTDVDKARDRLEFAILDAAEAKGKPVLGICRGFQLLNVHHGGTLLQHIHDRAAHWQTGIRSEGLHTVTVEPGSRLAHAVGDREVLVNSYHHQAVDHVGESLVPVAHAGDFVEAFESVDGRLLGVQWHPEHLIHRDAQLALFRDLVTRASGVLG